ncbi:MAG: M23 family metallopeptidase [Sandaracinaceae bacterium]
MSRLRVREVFGLSPLRARFSEAVIALRGDPSTPPSQFDLTSLKQLTRLPGWKVWAGKRLYGRSVPISNLYNYEQPPPEEGWSVRVTNVRDFRGKGLTYDSHNGTDFVVPVGTRVVAAAPGRVLRISREFHRGGLKIFIDHGDGLVTSSNHLARAECRVGDVVHRGQVIALSGYSGLDGFATFPFGIPHVHYNVWLDGRYVDPFAPPGEVSLFLTGNAPTPYTGTAADARAESLPEACWDPDAVEAALRACRSPSSRADIESADTDDTRAMSALFHLAYFPTRFEDPPASLYREVHGRKPRLDLPFRAADYDGIRFPD